MEPRRLELQVEFSKIRRSARGSRISMYRIRGTLFLDYIEFDRLDFLDKSRRRLTLIIRHALRKITEIII